MINKEHIASEMQALQSRITGDLEKIDGLSKFPVDRWKREEGGGGVLRLFKMEML